MIKVKPACGGWSNGHLKNRLNLITANNVVEHDFRVETVGETLSSPVALAA